MIFWLWLAVCCGDFASWEMIGGVDVPYTECLADLAISNSVLVPMVNVQSHNMGTIEREDEISTSTEEASKESRRMK
jgi:hypothetical protein